MKLQLQYKKQINYSNVLTKFVFDKGIILKFMDELILNQQ